MLLPHAVFYHFRCCSEHLWMKEKSVLQMPSQAAESVVWVALVPAAEHDPKSSKTSGTISSHLPKSPQPFHRVTQDLSGG